MLFRAITGLVLIATISAPVWADNIQSRYVVLGDNGTAIARVVTSEASCPALVLDGHATPMQARAKAETLPLRPTLSAPELTKPSAFPVTVCEATIPHLTKTASVAQQPLSLFKAKINRIVIIGDTGCRLKASDNAYQDCNDPKAYPFATIAAKAAAWQPDLVVHVGDYEYRETACPDSHAGCTGSPWGYGWDAWNADFFAPGAPLLAAAPLVLVRGNHENCARAGQGWYRLLDPRPLVKGHDCNDASNDVTGDYSEPYAVPLGDGTQIVVMDLAGGGNKAMKEDDPRLAQFRDGYHKLADYAAHAKMTFMATHKPILGFAAEQEYKDVKLHPGNPAIQSAFAKENPMLLPKGVDVLLAGHVHLWEQVSFSSDHPSQFVTGFSGTQEDTVPMPATLPSNASPAPGAVVEHFSSWINGFGFMTLERTGKRRWDVKVWNVDGQIVNRCQIDGRHSSCELAQVK